MRSNSTLPDATTLRARFSYDPVTGVLSWSNPSVQSRVKPGRVYGSIGKDGYRRGMIDGCLLLAHRIIFCMVTGDWPTHQIDHINGNRADNRWCNLRESTQAENAYNARISASNTSGFKGVTWHARLGRWQAAITLSGRTKYLGVFDTPEQAHAAYCKVAAETRGDYARFE